MIINTYNGEKEHPGIQPIRVLRHNIAYSFRNYHPDILKNHNKLKEKRYLTDNILYEINEFPIFYNDQNQLPYIDNGTITIHEIFLTIAAIVGVASILLLSPIANSKTHPDTDIRLFNFINNIPDNNDNNETWAFGCIILAYWDRTYGINLDFDFNNLSISYKDRFIKLINQ
jgi:hypothetical protein